MNALHTGDHLDHFGIGECAVRQGRKTALLYTGLAMIPNVILVLLLFVAMRTKLARCRCDQVSVLV
jgi:hypothetical protein